MFFNDGPKKNIKLKMLLVERGISQKQLAYDMGISITYISQIMTGRLPISKVLLEKMTTFFSCEPEDLGFIYCERMKKHIQKEYVSAVEDGQN